jgi:hypothetical protein
LRRKRRRRRKERRKCKDNEIWKYNLVHKVERNLEKKGKERKEGREKRGEEFFELLQFVQSIRP